MSGLSVEKQVPVKKDRATLSAELEAAKTALEAFDSPDSAYPVGSVIVDPGPPNVVLVRMDHHPQMPGTRYGWWAVVTDSESNWGCGFFDTLDQYRQQESLAADPAVVHAPDSGVL